MKKLILIVLLFMVGMFLTFETYGADYLIINDVIWEIEDSDQVEYEYDYQAELDRLYVKPVDNTYVYGDNFYSYDMTNIATVLTDNNISYTVDNGYYWISSISGDPIEIFVAFDVTLGSNTPTPNIRDIYDYFIVRQNTYTYVIKTNDLGSSIFDGTVTILQEIQIILDYDFDKEAYFVSDIYHLGLYLDNSYEIIDELEDASGVSMYFTNSFYPEHNNYDTGTTRNYWLGYQTDGTYPFRTGYVVDYFVDNIAPYANTQLELEALWTEWLDMWNDDGLTITFDVPVYELGLFVPSYYDDAIDPWWELTSPPYTSINIKLPDLYLDGGLSHLDINDPNYFDADIWGKQLVYTVNGTDTYNYSLGEDVDLYGYDVIERFGFYISTNAYLIKWNTNGGSSIADEFIAIGSSVDYKIPTYEGYTFVGWNQLNNNDPFITFNESIPSGTMVALDFPLTPQGNKTYYAVWRDRVVSVQLILNGGLRRDYEDFTSNTIFVLHGETVLNNYYNVPFTTAVYRVGYSLDGWYQDEALTIPFNSSTPITTAINIYAKWIYTGVGTGESPSVLDDAIDSVGLLNDGGLFLIYTIATLILMISISAIGLHPMVNMIVQLMLTILFIFLGWFSIWIILLLILVLVLFFIIMLKRGD